MPKLTSSGQPTIGYLIDLTEKDPSTLTKKEKQIVDEFGNEFYERVVKPWQEIYKDLYFPSIKNYVQSNQSFLTVAFEAQKSLVLFNRDLTDQLQRMLQITETARKSLDSFANLARTLQTAFIQDSPFTQLINKVITIPKLGEEITQRISLAASFKLTLTSLSSESERLKYYSLTGGFEHTTKLGNLRVETEGNINFRLQKLEEKILDTLTRENILLVEKLTNGAGNRENKDLYVIENIKYEKNSYLLYIGNQPLNIKPNSDIEQLCSVVFSNPKYKNKIWTIKEIVTKVYGEQYSSRDEKMWSEKLRTDVRHLNESVAYQTSPLSKGLLKYSNRSLTINRAVFEKSD